MLLYSRGINQEAYKASESQISRSASLDYTKCLMAIFVVALHTQAFSEFGTLPNWLTGNGLFRIAVPFFFVLSGYYFSYGVDLKKWLGRLLFLHVFWILIYVPLWSTGSMTTSAGKVLAPFVGVIHLWYLSALMLAGLMTILFSRISNKAVIWSAICMFCLGILISYSPEIAAYHGTDAVKFLRSGVLIRNGFVFGYPFFAIGYLLHRYRVENFVSLYWSVAGLSVGLFLVIAESYYLNRLSPTRTYIDLLFGLIVASPFLFITSLKLKLKGPGKFISQLSSGIYFIHFGVFFIIAVNGLRGFALFAYTLIATIAISCIAIALDKWKWRIL
jgi:surface polysaccharide O-acyltransferase-like enzyme